MRYILVMLIADAAAQSASVGESGVIFFFFGGGAISILKQYINITDTQNRSTVLNKGSEMSRCVHVRICVGSTKRENGFYCISNLFTAINNICILCLFLFLFRFRKYVHRIEQFKMNVDDRKLFSKKQRLFYGVRTMISWNVTVHKSSLPKRS
jgi:hypothetical protein